MKGLGLALVLVSPAAALDYACAAAGRPADVAPVTALSLGKAMMTYTRGGANLTARLNHGMLDRLVYMLEDSAVVLYVTARKEADGSIGFGPRLTLQQVFFDPTSPKLYQTTCEATR